MSNIATNTGGMNEPETAPVLQLKDLHRTFHQGGNDIHVLNGASLSINKGEIVALVGPSGAGKSTLLHIAGLLEKTDQGDVLIGGNHCSKMNDRQRTRMRRENLGFVYQYHHLLAEFSAVENIAIPQIVAGTNRKQAKERALELLSGMGLANRQSHRPARLSGGEQQRVAIARAIATRPRLLLADEPTGNLDPHTADDVFEILLELARGAGLAALIATHNPSLANKMDRIIRLEDGILIEG